MSSLEGYFATLTNGNINNGKQLQSDVQMTQNVSPAEWSLFQFRNVFAGIFIIDDYGGDLAQMAERRFSMQEVARSMPAFSIGLF